MQTKQRYSLYLGICWQNYLHLVSAYGILVYRGDDYERNKTKISGKKRYKSDKNGKNSGFISAYFCLVLLNQKDAHTK